MVFAFGVSVFGVFDDLPPLCEAPVVLVGRLGWGGLDLGVVEWWGPGGGLACMLLLLVGSIAKGFPHSGDGTRGVPVAYSSLAVLTVALFPAGVRTIVSTATSWVDV